MLCYLCNERPATLTLFGDRKGTCRACERKLDVPEDDTDKEMFE